MNSTATIDLEDELQRVEQQLDDIEEQQVRYLTAVGDEYDDPMTAPSEIHQRWKQLEDQRENVEARRRALKATIDAWGGSTIVVNQPTAGDVSMAHDRVNNNAVVKGNRPDAVTEERKLSLIRQVLVDTPDDAPDKPGDWQFYQVAELVFERVDELVSFGEVGAREDFRTSLSEAMADRSSERSTGAETTTASADDGVLNSE
jgi:hypothetical protein